MPRTLKAFLCSGLFFLAFNTLLHGQQLAVKNVKFTQRADSKVIVTYDLMGSPSQKYLIELFLLTPDSEEKIPLSLMNLAGDVGMDVRAGKSKKIIWDLLQEFPQGLSGDDFVFKVEAVVQKGKSKKWPWITGGIAVAGGVAYYFLSRPKNSDLSTNFPNPPARP